MLQNGILMFWIGKYVELILTLNFLHSIKVIKTPYTIFCWCNSSLLSSPPCLFELGRGSQVSHLSAKGDSAVRGIPCRYCNPCGQSNRHQSPFHKSPKKCHPKKVKKAAGIISSRLHFLLLFLFWVSKVNQRNRAESWDYWKQLQPDFQSLPKHFKEEQQTLFTQCMLLPPRPRSGTVKKKTA